MCLRAHPPICYIKMNRRFFLITMMLCLIVLAHASNRTEKQMKEIATQKLFPAAMSRSVNPYQKPSVTIVEATESYSVYEAEEQGFVIVSRNSDVKPILGYSSTKYDVTKLPCGLKWWQGAIDESLKSPITRSSTSSVPYQEKPFFITTEWGQGQPYNNQTPELSGKHAPTGCMATAMSQIMKFFRYPDSGKGSGSYTTSTGITKMVFFIGTYQWDQMKDTYSEAEVNMMSDNDKKPISTLMFHAGVASQMDYATDESGAYDLYAAHGLVNNFKYDPYALKAYARNYYTDDEWMTMVYQELQAGRPILYTGLGENIGGHAFVLDGIDADGNVHVNWGWDGAGNGYYDINILSPRGTSIAGSFNTNQGMIFGFKCQEVPDVDESYRSLWTCNGIYSITYTAKNRLSFATTAIVFNRHFERFEGTVDLVFKYEGNPANNVRLTVIDTDKDTGDDKFLDSYYGFGPDVVASKLSLINAETFAPGTYTVQLVSRAKKDTEDQPVRCMGGPLAYSVTKAADGVMTVTEKTNTTGIMSLSAEPFSTVSSSRIFDLQGREVKTPQKGVYIINGKKVVK